MQSVFPTQNAIFRRGDFLQNITTGTLTQPAPTGTLATVTPSVSPTIVNSGVVLATATKQVYFAYYTYQGTATESLPSAEFLIVNSNGYQATVTVPAAGAPAAATGFNLYVGLVSGGEYQQVAATALGSAATVPVPLTNVAGANRAATNASTNIFGLAVDDYDVTYSNSVAANFTNRAPFGADVSGPPMGFYEQYQTKVIPLSAGLQFEMSLLQAWTPALAFTTVGISYQTAYNTFAADNTQSNKILTIQGKVQGPNTNPNFEDVGGLLDTGARVIVAVTTTSALLL
jgi:hypothetical protein